MIKRQVSCCRLAEAGAGLWESGRDIPGATPGGDTCVYVRVPGPLLQVYDVLYVWILTSIR
jgi:hypothetical protein